MKNLLFVCIENSNRSQMAQAFAKIHGNTNINAYSAGSRPSGKVNPRAIKAMREIGYDLSLHASTSINDVPEVTYDYIVTMGCGDECPYIPAQNRIDWAIPDPREMDPQEFNQVRDLIELKVKKLLSEL